MGSCFMTVSTAVKFSFKNITMSRYMDFSPLPRLLVASCALAAASMRSADVNGAASLSSSSLTKYLAYLCLSPSRLLFHFCNAVSQCNRNHLARSRGLNATNLNGVEPALAVNAEKPCLMIISAVPIVNSDPSASSTRTSTPRTGIISSDRAVSQARCCDGGRGAWYARRGV